jgi:hypothetical protein
MHFRNLHTSFMPVCLVIPRGVDITLNHDNILHNTNNHNLSNQPYPVCEEELKLFRVNMTENTVQLMYIKTALFNILL